VSAPSFGSNDEVKLVIEGQDEKFEKPEVNKSDR